MKHKTLYKRASTGAIQVWWMERDFDRYRTHHGKHGGEVVSSEWTYAEPKNVGKANETTSEEQALKEVENTYKKKLKQGKYTEELTDIDEAKVSYFSPMLAQKFDPERLKGHYFIQPKFNGVRCIANKDGLWFRKGDEIVNVPHIKAGLEEFFEENPNAILDGELYNHDYKRDFNSLVSAIRKKKPTAATIEKSKEVVKFYLYDGLVSASSKDTFSERNDWLSYNFAVYLSSNPFFELSPVFRSSSLQTAKQLHERNKANGFEGSIIRLDEPYENKRTYSLMKYKDFQDEEFEILDIEEGKGNWSGVAKKVKLKLPDGVTSAAGHDYFHAGVKGDKEYCRDLLVNKEDYIGELGTVVFFDLTPDGVPLFPIFEIVRDYE